METINWIQNSLKTDGAFDLEGEESKIFTDDDYLAIASMAKIEARDLLTNYPEDHEEIKFLRIILRKSLEIMNHNCGQCGTAMNCDDMEQFTNKELESRIICDNCYNDYQEEDE